MRGRCGREIQTGSGLAAMAGGPDTATRASLGTSLDVFRDVGATQLLVNVSAECGTISAAGNDLRPWRTSSADVCTHDPAGMAMIDQVALEHVLTNGAPADVFSIVEFDPGGTGGGSRRRGRIPSPRRDPGMGVRDAHQ